jgi:hypothetical protein
MAQSKGKPMLATKLKGQITPNRKLIVEIPRDMTPGAVEVILLHEAPAKAVKPARRNAAHPAFGLWAKRADISDSAAYAAQLRQQVELGADRRG